ncbi:MAG: flippase-like domain-containing protein, partial [Thermoplasmatales archaeon]
MVIIILISSIFVPSYLAETDSPVWDENWSFFQEIEIPIDTSSEHAKYQPIDIPIIFENPCWAENERSHSIRVLCWTGYSWLVPLESQIYDLIRKDDGYISECSLVFLIPEEANGNEKYYIYYDDEEKSSPEYPDRVVLTTDSYCDEPLGGYTLSSEHYEIIQDGDVIYGVAYNGRAQDSIESQKITKLKPGSEIVEPKTGDQLAAFDFIYWYKEWNEGKKKYKWSVNPIITSHFVDKQVYIDGNLIVKFGILSKSADGSIQTTAIYKYYYCPTNDKRIYVHVKNEILKNTLPTFDEIDVTYVMLNCGVMKSSTLPNLNFGTILPQLHLCSEEELVRSYPVDTHPTNDEYMAIISKEDDCDLGSRAWISLDEGENGKAHAIIFGSNKILESGTGEIDGISLMEYQGKKIKGIPGIDSYFVDFYIGRNAYEPGVPRDEELPDDFVIEFDAEFFTTEDGGWKRVEKEAAMYQSLVNNQTKKEEEVIGENEAEKKLYNLTAYVNGLAFSFPFGYVLSLTDRVNASYIYAEAYKHADNCKACYSSTYDCFRPVSRIIPVMPSKEYYEEESLLKKFWMLMDLGWPFYGPIGSGNATFFKRANFQLEEGEYVLKIYRLNSVTYTAAFNNVFGNKFGIWIDRNEFIGYKIVDLKEDMDVHISCSLEGRLDVSVLNQYGKGIENAEIYLIKDGNVVVARGETGSDGKIEVRAPCSINTGYKMKVIYNGFEVHEETIRLGLIRYAIPLEKTVSFDVYNLTVKLKNLEGEAPALNAKIKLFSDEMQEHTELTADDESNNEYKFFHLYPANYNLELTYGPYIIEETVDISKTNTMTLDLYNLKLNITDKLGLQAGVELNVVLRSNDFKEPVVLFGNKMSPGEYLIKNIYPGKYKLKLYYGSFSSDEKIIRFPDNHGGELKISFTASYNVTTTVYNSRGNALENAKVLMIREDQKIEKITDKNGNVEFSLPPGVYVKEVYFEDKLIAKEKVNVLHGGDYNTVTNKEPLLPQITMLLAIIIVALAAFMTYRKKNILTFLKILAFSLALVAIVSPWWGIYGSSSELETETSTKMFLVPDELVTTTSAPNIFGGEVSTTASSDDEFVLAMEFSHFFVVIGCVFIIASILLDRLFKKRYSILSLLFGAASLIGVIYIFSLAMSVLTNAGPGSLFGSGVLDIAIPGEGTYEAISCSWGYSTGFYLCIGALLTITYILFISIRKIFKERDRNVKIRLKFEFDKKNIIKYFKKLMPLFGIIVFIWLIYDIGTGEIASTFLKLSPFYIIVSSFLLIPRVLVRNFQWQIILKKQNINIKFFRSVKLILIGWFYASVTPGYLGGLMILPYIKEETKQPIGKLFVNKSIHTITSQIGLYCMMVVGALLIAEHIPGAFLITFAVLAINGGIALFFIKKERGEKTF